MPLVINTTDYGIKANAAEITVRAYGEEVNPLEESFTNYARAVWFPILQLMPSLYQIRCSITGWGVASIRDSELPNIFTAAFIKLDLGRFDSFLNVPSIEEQLAAFESLVDDVATRVILMSRPAPSLLFNGDSLVIDALPSNRQLALLLNQFLWDSGMLRSSKSSDDIVAHYFNIAAIADWVDSIVYLEYGQALLQALVELDAKYRIRKLQFTRKEQDKLIEFRQSDPNQINLKFLAHFITSMIVVRDKNLIPIEEFPRTWTQSAYRDRILASTREDKSNLVAEMKKELRPSNAHVKKPVNQPKAAPKKSAKPKSEIRNIFDNLLMGDIKL